MAAPPALHCLVITPEEQVLEATATSVIIPAHDGQIGILANHAPLLCELGTGVLRVDAVGAGWREFCVDGGFAQVLNNEVVVLTERAAAGEDLAKAEVMAPVAPALLRLEGDAAGQHFVEHVQFRNLSFEHTYFELRPGDSNDSQGSASVTAAIVLRGARDIAFEHCRVSRLGNWAFELREGCSANRFVGNDISHVAAGGFRLGGGTDRNSPLQRTHGNLIADNALHHYGDEYPSAVGILLMHTSGNVVEHNEIHHGWYTGISVGWVWGYGRSVSRDNRIESNHIHDIGQGLLSDMGGIYTLGVSPGTVLRGNHIHDVDSNQYGGWGIYHDEGSSHILNENNLVYNTKFAALNIHYSKEVTVRNNIFALGKLEQLSRGRVDPHKSVYFENNIIYWKTGDVLSKNWKDQPYYFYYRPKMKPGEKGTADPNTTSTFDMNWNLYYNPDKKLDELKFNGHSWAEWQKLGKDRDSVFADPLFVDPDHGDFRLKPGSPAIVLGFVPFDVRNAGPRLKPGLENRD
jgi:ATP synthase F1 epsilon subunit